MIRFYWPGKPIPTWFQKIRFLEPQTEDNPYVAHGGFGIILLIKKQYHSLPIFGSCITIQNCNDILIQGQNGGVTFHLGFWAGAWNVIFGEYETMNAQTWVDHLQKSKSKPEKQKADLEPKEPDEKDKEARSK